MKHILNQIAEENHLVSKAENYFWNNLGTIELFAWVGHNEQHSKENIDLTLWSISYHNISNNKIEEVILVRFFISLNINGESINGEDYIVAFDFKTFEIVTKFEN